VNNILEQLKILSKALPLEDYFTWNIPGGCPLDIPENISDNYSRNIYLKEHFKKHLENDDGLFNHYWVIQEWGSIRSFKKMGRNNDRILEFKKGLIQGKLTKPTFNLISSLSKIAAFLNPKEYAIYDSRAIYALNWLIFCYSDITELFPQPSGRSSILAQYDIQTIFRLSGKKCDFRSYKTAYFDYCNFLKSISKEVYGDEAPYKVEMLLFLAAPTKIIDSIKSSVTLKINPSA